jgi:hypothetical protein
MEVSFRNKLCVYYLERFRGVKLPRVVCGADDWLLVQVQCRIIYAATLYPERSKYWLLRPSVMFKMSAK